MKPTTFQPLWKLLLNRCETEKVFLRINLFKKKMENVLWNVSFKLLSLHRCTSLLIYNYVEPHVLKTLTVVFRMIYLFTIFTCLI